MSIDQPEDAIELLAADHEEVRRLFGQYEELAEQEADLEDRVALATQICFRLLVHAQLEEELLYPVAEDALGDEEFVNEARAEHDAARDAIVRLETTDPREELYDDTVLLLAEIVDHHVQEEEAALFPRLRESALDLEQLGATMAARRQELFDEVMANLGERPDD